MKARIEKIKRVWRRRRLHKKLILEVNRRIAFKNQERYRKEMERQQKE